MPPGAAVEPPGHALAQLDLSVTQRQEQISHAVFGRDQRGEGGEGHTGAQVQQHGVDGLAAEVLGQSSPTETSPIASPSPVHNDFSDVDQVGPQESSMSLKISKSCCGFVRVIRSSSSSTGVTVSGVDGCGSAPAMTVPSAFNDHSASRTPYGRLCTWNFQPPSVSRGCMVS